MGRIVHSTMQRTLRGPDSAERQRQAGMGVTPGGPCAHIKSLGIDIGDRNFQ